MATTLSASSSLTTTTRCNARAASRCRSTVRHRQPHPSSSVPAPARVKGWGSDAAASDTVQGESRGHRRGELLVSRGRKGMLGQTLDGEEGGKKAKKDKAAKKKGSDSLAGSLEPGFAGSKSTGGSGGKGSWLSVGNVKEDFNEKPIKALVLANGVEETATCCPRAMTTTLEALTHRNAFTRLILLLY